MNTVPCDVRVTMRAAGPLTHLCPHVPEVDHGYVSITWTTAGTTFELHALAAYLAGFAEATLSHEEITDRIRDDLTAASGVVDVAVETTWATAGMDVRCSTSPTPAGQR